MRAPVPMQVARIEIREVLEPLNVQDRDMLSGSSSDRSAPCESFSIKGVVSAISAIDQTNLN